MPHQGSLRPRPDLHLALTPLTDSPRRHQQATPSSTPRTTPGETPFAKTAYSPWISPGFGSSASKDSNASLLSTNSLAPSGSSKVQGRGCRRLKNTFSILLAICILPLIWWTYARNDGLAVSKERAAMFGRELLLRHQMHEFQFFPATDTKIHYVGRWVTTPNRLRKDASFPGAYFDVKIKNTTSFMISLHNRPRDPRVNVDAQTSNVTTLPLATPHPGHYSFHPFPSNQVPAQPVTLIARLDNQDYFHLPNSSSLVPICLRNLDPQVEYEVRIIAPRLGQESQQIAEFEGIWVSKGGALTKVAGSAINEGDADENQLQAEDDMVGAKHSSSLNEVDMAEAQRSGQWQGQKKDEQEVLRHGSDRKKVLEVISDSSETSGAARNFSHVAPDDLLRTALMSWDSLLADMFGVDHVGLGVDCTCLTQDCIGGAGSPAGMGDVFFRSGPHGSPYYDHPWTFGVTVPDVLIINLGATDNWSFTQHSEQYNVTMHDLTERFEKTYLSLVKGIRGLAYPKHPAVIQSEQLGQPGIIPYGVPPSVPIFIMRPFSGEIEQSTQHVAAKLRGDGDMSVFWLDTSGWLDMPNDGEQSEDVFFDDSGLCPKWRLTQRGNGRVAMFLHAHVCRYLASNWDQCAFLPQEIYTGSVFNPDEAALDRFLEKEKATKLKDLFWATAIVADDGAGGDVLGL